MEGRLRLRCPDAACGYVFWDNPVPVVAAVVERDGEILLVRNHGWPEKWLGLVAGFLERGETPEDGILRELREELGLEGRIVSRIGCYPFFELNQLILAFHVRAAGEVALGPEIAAWKSFPPAQVRPWKLGTGQALRDWLVAGGYSVHVKS